MHLTSMEWWQKGSSVPKGTIVGFFEGTLALGSIMVPLNDFHHKCMMLNDFSFVDGSLHMSFRALLRCVN
jgi:hypothetical protein